MKYVLIQLSPLTRMVNTTFGQSPILNVTLDEESGEYVLPETKEGYAYVPFTEYPTDLDPLREVAYTELTETSYGWLKRDMTLAERKSAASSKIDEMEAAQEEAGLVVGDLTLKAGVVDRSQFTGLLVMLREAEALGALPETASITDADGEVHDLPVATVRQILTGYGGAYVTAWATIAAARKAVSSAADEAALDAAIATYGLE